MLLVIIEYYYGILFSILPEVYSDGVKFSSAESDYYKIATGRNHYRYYALKYRGEICADN